MYFERTNHFFTPVNFNAADIIKSIFFGVFYILPLIMVSLNTAIIYLAIAPLIAYAAAAFICLLADAGQKMSESFART